jgi:hypothetical protein
MKQTDPAQIKRIKSAKFLLDSGLLFEINRRVLHPFGLALEVISDNNGNPLHIGDLWDYRNDPEGIIFGDDILEAGSAKFEKFLEEFGNAKLKERVKALGYIVQPVPGENHEQTNKKRNGR